MKSLHIHLLTLLIFLSACSTYKEYNEDAFPEFTWEPGQEVEFKPVIEDISSSYSLGLGLRHVYGFRQSKINVSIRIIAPSGNQSITAYHFKIKDADGEYVGSCAGDMCDLETIVDENFVFTELGEHRMILSHDEGENLISGVMAVGLVLDKN